MKISQFLCSASIAALIDHALAYPSMGAKIGEILRLAKRDNPVGTNIALGDLVGGARTTTGTTITQCLANTIDCYLTTNKTYVAPPLLSVQCLADTCCQWDWIQKDLVADFLAADGTCTQIARAAIRLGFHDAGPWKQGNTFGGADGSIVINPEEMTRTENNGLQAIVAYTQKMKQKFPFAGVADLIQFQAKIAIVTCPLGPRMRFFIGRPDSLLANPPGLMPAITQSAESLVDMFNAKTIGPDGLAALVGAHTTANQFFAIPASSGSALDPTPGVWDDTFYNFTANAASTAPGVTKFPSDVALSQSPLTKPSFTSFMDSHTGRDTWDNSFARAYLRLSLLGVHPIQEMTDCSKVIPSPLLSFKGSLGHDNDIGFTLD